MILAFNHQFLEPILNGSKIHTIRSGNRWKVGDKIHFATGVRTKNYNCFKEGVVKNIKDIEIHGFYQCFDGKTLGVTIKIDGKYISNNKIEILYKNDGFKNFKEFIDFFKDRLPFKGQLIHWIDFKY